MFGSTILDVAIGVIFVFALVSIICAAIREGLEAWLKTRAAYLERGIRELLHDPEGTGLARSFYHHPLVYSLYSGEYEPKPLAPSPRRGGDTGSDVPTPVGREPRRTTEPPVFEKGENLPSYIPSKNFALALMDIAARGRDAAANSGPGAPAISPDTIRANIMNIESVPVRRAILTALDTSRGDIDRARQSLEDWYDGAMDRVSGWYKRSTQRIIFWIGLAVALVMNVNVLTIADYLNRDDTARAAFVAAAQRATTDTAFVAMANGTAPASGAKAVPRIAGGYEVVRKSVDSLSLPIGWSQGWGSPRQDVPFVVDRWPSVWNNLVGPIFGLLLTAFAATLGAPFWFDVLNRVMVIRSTVKPHEKSPEEGSEDRQDKGKAPDKTTEIVVAKEGTSTSAPVTPAASAAARTLVVPDEDDPESDIDACHALVGPIDESALMTDEQLPAATGGVA